MKCAAIWRRPLLWLTITTTVVDSQTLASKSGNLTIVNWWSVKSGQLFQWWTGEETRAEMLIAIMKVARSWPSWLIMSTITNRSLTAKLHNQKNDEDIYKWTTFWGRWPIWEEVTTLWGWFKRLNDWLMEQLFLSIFENSLKWLWKVL